MDKNKVLYYNDGHGISVTRSELHVRNTLYPLSRINTHKFVIIQPHRAFFVIPIVGGSLFFICGAADLLPMMSATVSIFGISVIGNAIVMSSGVAILLLGILIMFRSRERYAVRIFTNYGEKNAVVSSKREYIKQIIDGLNHAFMDATKPET